MKIFFDIPVFYAVLISLAVALFYAALLYYIKDRINSYLSRNQKITAGSLRFLAVFILTMLFFSPRIKHTKEIENEPVIIFAQDNSESIISTKDSTYFKNNYQKQIKALLKEISKDKNAIVKFITFGNKPEIKDSFDFSDKITNFDKLFKFVSQSFKNENIKLMIVASDGIMNNGENPLYNDYPIDFKTDFLLLGDTTVYPDIAIENVEYNNIVLQNSITPVRITVKEDKLKDNTATVTISENGKTLDKKTFQIKKNHSVKTLTFKFEPKTKGIHSYTIGVSTSAQEKTKQNNTKTIKIDVIDATQQILILANSPHPDLGAIISALNTNLNYKTTLAYISDFDGNIDSYNLVIFHNLPSPNHKITSIWQQLSKRNIPALFITGTQTDIKSFNSLNLPVKIKASKNLFEDTYPIINNTFQSFNIDNSSGIIDKLPPLKSIFGEYSLPSGSEVLMYQKIKNIQTDKPLIVFGQSDNEKTGVITGENIWRWRIYDNLYNGNNDFFNSLVNNIASYLAIKVKKQNLNIFVDKLIKQYEPVIFNAQFFNEIYQPINNPDLSLEIKNIKTGKTQGFVFDRTENGYKLEIGTLLPGDYEYTATLAYKGKKYTKKGVFSIEKVNLEQINTTADAVFLKKLARKFDGNFYYDLKTLRDSVSNYNFLVPTLTFKTTTNPVTNSIWWLIVITILLSLEWLLKKLWGSI